MAEKIRLAERGLTARPETSWFQALSAGSTGQPAIDGGVPPPGPGGTTGRQAAATPVTSSTAKAIRMWTTELPSMLKDRHRSGRDLNGPYDAARC